MSGQGLIFTVHRDSVCAGDDCDAPHEIGVAMPADATLRDFCEDIRAKHYFASISGGKATWILLARLPLAVLAQQWSQPHFLVPAEVLISSVIDPAAHPHLKFLYHCQVDPDRVFDCLLAGQPLPDRYGR